MREKWDAFMGRSGFFVTMALCLLVAGVSGYFLFLDEDEPAVQESPVLIMEEPAVSVQDLPEQEEPLSQPEEETPPPAAAVISIEPVQETTSMPEIPVDPKPVVAKPPHPVSVPLTGEVLTAFSMDTLLFNDTLDDWRTHDGVDISAPEGTSVLAACAGTVLAVEQDALMGTTVTVSHHDGYETTYANLKEGPPVTAGDRVSAGEVIGSVGATAVIEAAQPPHLHFSVTQNGVPVDPDTFLNH